MSNNKLISVVMGIYNCADTLEEAVQCIIDQTYTNWELIMCDDGSKDNTYEVAQELAKRDSRIIVIKNEKNITLAPTLNHCIEYAKGDYIARMDGDDICPPDRFEKEIDFLENNKDFAFVSCFMNLYDTKGIYRVIKHKPVPTPNDMVKRSQFCHAGCMIRTDAIRAIGCYSTSKNFYRIEDYDLWTRLLAHGYQGYNLQEVLYSMRDDRNAQKRRDFQNRLNEARVKAKICKEFNLPLVEYRYIALPIIKWLMPNFVYKIAHKKKEHIF